MVHLQYTYDSPNDRHILLGLTCCAKVNTFFKFTKFIFGNFETPFQRAESLCVKIVL